MPAPHVTDEQLSAQLDGALGQDESAAVHSHLADCVECAARRELLRATSQAIAGLPGEELPRPLDLAFTRQGVQPSASDTPRGFAARVIHGRPPAWLPTAVAAAAVLVLAITVAPRFLPPTGGTSRSTAGLAGQEATVAPQFGGAPAQGNQSPGASSQGQAGSINKANPGLLAPRDTATQTGHGPDGSTLTIVVSPPGASSGLPTLVVVKLVGGPSGTALAPQGMELFIGQGATQVRLAASTGGSPRLNRGEELDLSGQWSAGALVGQPAAGTYTLIGRARLNDGVIVEVTLPYIVAGG
jgi:hypothetical protein